MLKSILVITITVAQLQGLPEAYDAYLDYDLVESGTVSDAKAAVWGAPESGGQRYALLQPESDAEVYLRFIESAQPASYSPMTTHGWNATEILVVDPDAVAARLENSPFEIIGPPYDLWEAPNAPRAMQAIGPGNELVYLTSNADFTVNTAIDRVFIMVLAGPSMAAFNDFYGDRLGLFVSEPTPFKIGVIARAQGLSPDTEYPLSVARVSSEFLIELDEYPDVAQPREVPAGGLPPGIAMVSFIVEDLDKVGLDWRATPAALPGTPYNGRRVGVAVGPAGEWLELIEQPAAPASAGDSPAH